jgi:hypothetical protein
MSIEGAVSGVVAENTQKALARSRSLSRIFAGLSTPPDLRIVACSGD